MRRPLLLLACAVGACTVPDSPLSDPVGDGAADGVVQVDSALPTNDATSDTTIASSDSALDTATTTDATTDVVAEAGRDLGSDKSKFLGASRCSTSGAVLCEDFESGTLDTSVWTPGGTAPVVDGAQHARGSKALHVMRVNNGSSTIKETKTFPALKNKYFGRMFINFAQLPLTTTTPAFSFAHWTLIAASGTGVTGEIRVGGFLTGGKNLFGVGTDSGTDTKGTGDWTTLDNDPAGKPVEIPTGTWICLEWMHDGDADETRFWWDGVEHTSMHTTSTVHGKSPSTNTNPYLLPDFTQVVIGWNEYQTSTQTYESWIDEIIIDKERIGCVL